MTDALKRRLAEQRVCHDKAVTDAGLDDDRVAILRVMILARESWDAERVRAELADTYPNKYAGTSLDTVTSTLLRLIESRHVMRSSVTTGGRRLTEGERFYEITEYGHLTFRKIWEATA